MGRYRDAFESSKFAGKRPPCHFEPPATDEQISAAETELGLTLPEPLRQLYQEFDGVWWGKKPPAETETETWIVLPTRLLRHAKDYIARLWYAGDIAGWSEEFAKSVVFTMPEHGASFWFMTDSSGWGIPTGLVGKWDHDGDAWNPNWPLERYLAHWGSG